MRKPTEDHYTVLKATSYIDAKRILNTRHKQGWQFKAITAQEDGLVLVLEKEEKEQG